MSSDLKLNIVIQAVDQATVALSNVGTSVTGLTSRFQGLGDMVQLAGGFLLGYFTYDVLGQLKAAIEDSIQTFIEFEKTLADIQIASGLTGDEFLALQEDLVAAAEAMIDYGVSINDALKATEALVKAGLQGQEAVDALKGAIFLARLEAMDYTRASEMLVQIMNQFGLSASEATRVVDVLVNASIAAVGSAEDLAQGLSFAGTMASQLGFSLEETVAALVALNNAGLEAGRAGRNLQAMLNDLINHSEDLGFSIYDLQGNLLSLPEIIDKLVVHLQTLRTEEERNAYLLDVFGQQGIRAANILISLGGEGKSAGDVLRELAASLGEAGSAEEAMTIRTETLGGKVDKFRAKVDSLKLKIGVLISYGLEPAVDAMIDWADAILTLDQRISELDTELSDWRQSLSETQYGIDDLAKDINALQSDINTWIKQLQTDLAKQMDNFVSGIDGMQTSLTQLSNYINITVQDTFNNFINWITSTDVSIEYIIQEIKNFNRSLEDLLPSMLRLGDALINTVTAAIQQVVGNAQEMNDGIKNVEDAANSFIPTVKEFAQKIIDLAVAFKEKAVNAVTEFNSILEEKLKPAVERARDKFREAFQGMVGWMQYAVDMWSELGTLLKDSIDEKMRAIFNIFNNTKKWILDVWGTLWNSVVSTVTGALNTVIQTIKDVFGDIVSFFNELWKAITGGSIWVDMWRDVEEVARVFGERTVRRVGEVVSDIHSEFKGLEEDVRKIVIEPRVPELGRIILPGVGLPGGGGGGSNITVNVSLSGVVGDVDYVADIVSQKIVDKLRMVV